jgi:hypothetical protein
MEQNQKINDIYEAYRDEMASLLTLEEKAPHRFEDAEFVEHFALQVDRLATLIDLFSELKIARSA